MYIIVNKVHAYAYVTYVCVEVCICIYIHIYVYYRCSYTCIFLCYVTYVEVPPYLSRRQAAYVVSVQGRSHAVTGLSQCVLSQVCHGLPTYKCIDTFLEIKRVYMQYNS